MNKIFKRLLSVVLALVMVVGLVPLSKPVTVEAAGEMKTIYFQAPDNWTETPGIYMWEDGTNSNTGNPVSMTNVSGKIYKYEYPGNYNKVIFTSKAGTWENQTSDISISSDQNMYAYNGSNGYWTNYDENGRETLSGDTKTIYLDTRNYLPNGRWDNAYIYLYNPTTGAIFGPTSMTNVTGGIYSYDVDTSIYTYVIFRPNADNWSEQTNGMAIPSDQNMFICKTFGNVTSGSWGYYSESSTSGEFPSNVTGKATFFDLYTDYEIDPNVYGNAYSTQSKTGILRAFDQNVNQAISTYWKNSGVNAIYPLYFNAFQPYFYAKTSNDNWWKSADDISTYDKYESGITNNGDLLNFSWFVNRVLAADPENSSASLAEGQDGAVVQGLVNEELDENGNITAKETKVVLPQFNSQFYEDNPSVGKQYDTVEFPFAVREIDGVKYYQFDSGASGSDNKDVVRMNEDGTLSYYDGTKDPGQIVNGIPGNSEEVEDHTPGFFPFNVPADSSSADKYDSAENKLNYGFGMKLEIEFTMDEDGTISTVNGDKVPATFEFSGDDDVWVYVDGKLALDMGGSHGIATGAIDFSTLGQGSNEITSTVSYVKGVHSGSGLTTNLDEIYNTEQGYGDESYINVFKDQNAGTLSNVEKKTAFDASDPTEIHTLTIFYEERGMYESNFKATFNLEQPTKLKVTNEVNVENINLGLQDATALAAESEEFNYQFTDGAGKTYSTKDGDEKTVASDGNMTINDGQSATFVKQFDRKAELSLKQTDNEKFTTSWSFSEMDANEQSSNPISASYLEGKDSLTIGDGRIEGHANDEFQLENKITDDDSVPARVLVEYFQNPETGNISIKKVLEEGFESEDVFEFEVKFTQIFGSTTDEVLSSVNSNSLTYNVYNDDDQLIATRVTGDDGTVKIQAGQYAVIANIPVDSKYSISEVSGVDYQITDLKASERNNDNPSITDYIATGTVVADEANVYDLYTFTNGEVRLQDAFLVEMDKENTLSVIPDESVDGTLSGNLKTIRDAYDKVKSENQKVGIVFVEADGKFVVDNKDGKEFPMGNYTVDGVSYKVTYAEDGKPVLKVTPSSDAVSEKNTLEVKYQLVELNNDGSIKYSDKIIENDDETTTTVTTVDIVTPVITTTNYLYKANNDIYVLDYGLDVDLADRSADSGMFQNDTLENPSLPDSISTYWNTAVGANAEAATASTEMEQNTSKATSEHGTITPEANTKTGFEISNSADGEKNPTVKYSMNEFLSDKDYYNYNVMLKKSENLDDAQTSNRFRLNLTSNVTVMPASVVYYEDNFNSDDTSEDSSKKIIYTGSEEDISTTDSTLTLTQSNGQTEQYGHDDAYATGAVDSAGSSTMLTAQDSDTKATFTFTGTGFDIIARTTDETAAIFCIIGKVAEDGTVTLVKTITVDTYYANGDLYQIPVIHETDLDYGKYQVILGIKASSKGSIVYLDGVRIYNPLGTEGDTAYIDNEEGATITSVSDLILGDCEITETGIVNDDGTVILNGQTVKGSKGALFDDSGDTKPFYPMGYNKVEDINGSTSTTTGSVLTYLNAGPTNELYLDDGSALVFVATEAAGVENRTIQIEAKLLKDGNDAADELPLEIMNNSKELKEIASVNSSTAMYYEIPVDQCIKLSDGKYLVAIDGGTGGDVGDQYLSFSNLKVKGYTLSNPLEDADALEYINTEDLEDATTFVAVDTFSVMKRSWSNYDYTVTVKEGTFGENTPAFKMYYKNANDELTSITVYTKLKENKDGNEVYSLRFKAPNAAGQFPVLIHTYINGEESEEFISTNMTVK